MNDHERFTILWTRTQPIVASFVHALIPDRHEGEDILQNVAVVLLRKFDEYDTSRSFTNWALGIARNEVHRLRRNHSRRPMMYDPELTEKLAATHEALAPELEQRSYVLRECIKTIKGRPREILELRYEQALPTANIAERLGMAGTAVRMALSRIRDALSKCVERRMAALERH